MSLELGHDVLLFFEDRDRDTFVRGDRRLRRKLRKAVGFLRPHKQRVSGFEVSFLLLCRALSEANQTLHINDYRLARRNPHFPIGICGYSHILDDWTLPNPAVLGPGLFDHPKQAPNLMKDPRFRVYVAFCDWMRTMFATIYGDDAMVPWFGGIELDEWPDIRDHRKDIDFLVYDKIRWNRETLVPGFRQTLIDELDRREYSHEIVRYGQYTHEQYRRLLARSRALLYICEHETQGMAYQEALASNVPVLAWDQGFWLDPNRPRWEVDPVPATSVPYFSNLCGERFGWDDFPAALDRFIERLHSYTPRSFVAQHLSLEQSADLYLQAYKRAGSELAPPQPTAAFR